MLIRLPALGLLLLTGACASIVTGTTQTMSVVTEPAGAVCTLGRNGETVGIVNPTPGSLTVGRSAHAMTVRCDRAGYQAGVATVSPSFQAMTLGNILIGGVVGVIVDASSGAINQYPDNVAVALVPLPLPTVPPVAVMQPIPDEAPLPRGRRGRVGV